MRMGRVQFREFPKELVDTSMMTDRAFHDTVLLHEQHANRTAPSRSQAPAAIEGFRNGLEVLWRAPKP